MDKAPDVQQIYEQRVEMLGVDSVDFILEDATFIRIQVMIRGKIKVVPSELVENIAKLIQQYELKKKEVV